MAREVRVREIAMVGADRAITFEIARELRGTPPRAAKKSPQNSLVA